MAGKSQSNPYAGTVQNGKYVFNNLKEALNYFNRRKSVDYEGPTPYYNAGHNYWHQYETDYNTNADKKHQIRIDYDPMSPQSILYFDNDMYQLNLLALGLPADQDYSNLSLEDRLQLAYQAINNGASLELATKFVLNPMILGTMALSKVWQVNKHKLKGKQVQIQSSPYQYDQFPQAANALAAYQTQMNQLNLASLGYNGAGEPIIVSPDTNTLLSPAGSTILPVAGYRNGGIISYEQYTY